MELTNKRVSETKKATILRAGDIRDGYRWLQPDSLRNNATLDFCPAWSAVTLSVMAVIFPYTQLEQTSKGWYKY